MTSGFCLTKPIKKVRRVGQMPQIGDKRGIEYRRYESPPVCLAICLVGRGWASLYVAGRTTLADTSLFFLTFMFFGLFEFLRTAGVVPIYLKLQ